MVPRKTMAALRDAPALNLVSQHRGVPWSLRWKWKDSYSPERRFSRQQTRNSPRSFLHQAGPDEPLAWITCRLFRRTPPAVSRMAISFPRASLERLRTCNPHGKRGSDILHFAALPLSIWRWGRCGAPRAFSKARWLSLGASVSGRRTLHFELTALNDRAELLPPRFPRGEMPGFRSNRLPELARDGGGRIKSAYFLHLPC